ncbi:MAG: VOC family protein [Chloroflexota bacterium]
MSKLLDHVCILVKDIDQAIEHYKNIIATCAPEVANQKIEKHEAFTGKDKYFSVVFTAGGDGCNIQLLQPLDAESPLGKRLAKYGEHIHHIAFASSQLENTVKGLKKRGVTLHSDKLFYDANNPSRRWNWILPQYAHGALIEVIDELKVK